VGSHKVARRPTLTVGNALYDVVERASHQRFGRERRRTKNERGRVAHATLELTRRAGRIDGCAPIRRVAYKHRAVVAEVQHRGDVVGNRTKSRHLDCSTAVYRGRGEAGADIDSKFVSHVRHFRGFRYNRHRGNPLSLRGNHRCG
jgi:hypothetical protein